MSKKIRALILPSAVFAVVLVAMVVMFVPTAASLPEGTKYSAGNFLPSTTICVCPVQQGDCMCAWVPEEEP